MGVSVMRVYCPKPSVNATVTALLRTALENWMRNVLSILGRVQDREWTNTIPGQGEREGKPVPRRERRVCAKKGLNEG